MSEALAPEAFMQDLGKRIEARRTFGGHPLWHEIADGKLDREQLGLFAVQFFLQVREFPRAVSAMHANCPFPKERMELAENIYEEETGRISVAIKGRFTRGLDSTTLKRVLQTLFTQEKAPRTYWLFGPRKTGGS